MCQFDFPLSCYNGASIGLDSKVQPHFEGNRNDPLLNLYTPVFILAWHANIDLKLVLSWNAALKYVIMQ